MKERDRGTQKDKVREKWGGHCVQAQLKYIKYNLRDIFVAPTLPPCFSD